MLRTLRNYFFPSHVLGELITKLETMRYRRGALALKFFLPPDQDKDFHAQLGVMTAAKKTALKNARASYEYAIAQSAHTYEIDVIKANDAFDRGFRKLVIAFVEDAESEPRTQPTASMTIKLAPLGERR